MARRTPPRRNNKDSNRRGKKKISPLTIGKIEFVDYKDNDMLRKFVSERAKLKPRRVTGNSEKQQREVARAVKNAREMALLPYTNRVTTQRRERRSDDRGPRADGRRRVRPLRHRVPVTRLRPRRSRLPRCRPT